jgi:hypothetical protein
MCMLLTAGISNALDITQGRQRSLYGGHEHLLNHLYEVLFSAPTLSSLFFPYDRWVSIFQGSSDWAFRWQNQDSNSGPAHSPMPQQAISKPPTPLINQPCRPKAENSQLQTTEMSAWWRPHLCKCESQLEITVSELPQILGGSRPRQFTLWK